MKIVHMIEDYEILCHEAESIGKFEAYKRYTEKYPFFFHGVFQYLYCQPLENLKPMIERVDFAGLLQVARQNYQSGLADYTIGVLRSFAERMGIDFPFTLLLGLELSNIGGCATPRDFGEAYLYIGMDRPLTKEWADVFVPHEVFHMMRYCAVQDSVLETVFSRTVEEGLASYAPLWAHGIAWNTENVAKTLGVSERQAGNLMEHTEQLLARLTLDGNKPISAETMRDYFTAQAADVEFPVIGYYIGLYLTHLAVTKGESFEAFAALPVNEIIRMWFS